MIIDEHFDRSTVRVHLGDVVELRLAENPTTGFRWRMTKDGRPVCDVKDEAYQRLGTAPGAGGVHRWTFDATQTGRSTVELLYRRAWEAAAPAGRSFSFTLEVDRRAGD